MLRNVTAIEEWEFPYSIIQSFEDYIIIEVPLTYCVREESEPIIDEDGNVTFEVIETYVDTPLPGVTASWEDVTDPLQFDIIQIGDSIYSWDERPESRRLHITKDGFLAVAKYTPFNVNGMNKGNIKHSIVPAHQPLKYERQTFTVNGGCQPELTFRDAKNKATLTMRDILLIDREGVAHTLNFDQPNTEAF